MDTKLAKNGEGGACRSRSDFLRALERELTLDKGSLNEDQTLASLESWDSMAAVQFIALVDEQIGITVPGDQIAKAKTVSELLSLLGNRLTV
jgi:acyl carrier protein